MTDSIPVLGEEEIALNVLKRALDFLDWRVAALHACETLAATITTLTANQRTCICSDDALCGYHDEKFIRPLEAQITALESRLREAEADRNAMLGLGEPWPLRDVLKTLADFAAAILRDHDCDRDGHEVVRVCVGRATDIIEGIEWNHPAALQDAKDK
jgi:hypothetical protein